MFFKKQTLYTLTHDPMPFPDKMKRDVWNRQRGLCNYCGLGLTFNGGCEMDHSVPKSWGGKDVSENAQLSNVS